VKWERKLIQEVADFSLGKMLDQKKNRGQAMPYLANVNVRWGEFDFEDLREMRFEPHEVDRYGLKYGDIVMCEGGEPGRCAVWKNQVPGMMIQKALHRIRPHTCLDSRFLFYSFLKKGKSGELSGLFTGSTIKHLPREKLAKVEIDVPPLPTQLRITEILSAYDDLIENNRRRIALLEEAAEMLYREWFVHFRFPGHEHVKIVNDLPDGWERLPIAAVAENVSYGFTASADSEIEGPKFLRITDIVNGPIKWDSVPRCSIAETKLSGVLLAPADIVVARTGATTGWARRVGRLPEPAVFASYLVRFRFGKTYCPELAATYMQSDSYKRFVKGNLGGAAQPNASARVLGSAVVPVPPAPLQSAFATSVQPIFDQIDVLVEQSQALIQARDLLLPWLMSGEFAV
jgi:type I restriction enzyme, S subunit